MKRIKLVVFCVGLLLVLSCGGGNKSPVKTAHAAPSPSVEVVTVMTQKLAITVHLPGELAPYEVVAIFPKVTGFVESIGVDRGSRVKTGQLIARLEAPELVAQRAEAQSKSQVAEAQLAAAQAKVVSDESTYQHLKAAAATPGVVAGNDLFIAEKAVDADRAQVKAQEDNVGAAKQALQAVSETEAYLQVKAPFDGIVRQSVTCTRGRWSGRQAPRG